ncbi:MAG: tRNA (adenosine(37)-N6)-threonylcarbamoyltransferase complex transferase subunit TsaD, partial [Candidatus Pacebacteria bacterium CG10_big_fil_rev_8_21_14_0_10_56_10]
MTPPLVLAIDTSCDETAAAVTSGRTVMSNVIASQSQLHRRWGGVFPTVAKQAHQELLPAVITAARRRAGADWSQLAAIAVTQGPGLAPALEVGLKFADRLGSRHQLPLVPVNHLEGHLLSVLAQPRRRTGRRSSGRPINAANPARVSKPAGPTPNFPVLGLIVSGAHTELVLVNDFGRYHRLGWTVDDAAGEALDKIGRMLGLGYPAGPVIEQLAKRVPAAALAAADAPGSPWRFPLPMTASGDYNFSFSGLKTFAKNLIGRLEQAGRLDRQTVALLAAVTQRGVLRHLTYKLNKVLADHPQLGEVWLSGGVAANIELRRQVRAAIKPYGLKLATPYTKRLCGDNAAMIGLVGGLKLELELGKPTSRAAGQEKLVVPAGTHLDRRPRWPL